MSTRATQRSAIAFISGAVAALIGIIGLLGWLTDRLSLAGAVRGYGPAAPNSALCFILLGAALCAVATAARPARPIATIAGGLVLLVATTRFVEYVAGVDLGVDLWFFTVRAQASGLAPFGRMAFFTALTLMFASGAVLATVWARVGAISADVARALGALTAVIGAIVLLGYAYESPLLYGDAIVPMALPTALVFVLVGGGIVALQLERARFAQRAIDATLQEIDERFRAAFAQSAIGFAHVGLDGRFLEVNRALCELTGFDDATLRTKSLKEITNPADADLDRAELERLTAGEISSYQMDKRYRHRDGGDTWVRLTASAVRAVDGSVRHFLAQLEDITQQRAAEDSRVERAHQQALHQLALGIRHEMNNALISLVVALEQLASHAKLPPEMGAQVPPMLALVERLRGALQRLNRVEQLPVVQYLGGTLMRDVSGGAYASADVDEIPLTTSGPRAG